MRKTTTIKNCENCKNKFAKPFWESKIIRFCSKKCSGLFRIKISNFNNKKVCLNCNKNFIRKSCSKGLFCSHLCYSNSMILGNKPNCIDCNKKLSAYKVKRCIKCFAKNRSGKNHPKWISDRTKLVKKQERNDSAYKEWRKNVWLRDNWKCKIVNPDCKGRIEAHHILSWTQYPELRYEVNNGITLCHFHHPRKIKDEMNLSPYFQELVGVKVK